MALPAVKHRMTAAEYLDAEHAAVDHHEFHDGEMLAMAGSTFEHDQITGNAFAALKSALDGTDCRVMTSNMRVRPGPSSRYVYPDLSVVCGPPQFDPDDRRRTTVTNPRIVVEVLSDSTEAYDRGGKFTLYRECETLEEYVLIAQDRPAVEAYHRQPDGTWSFAAWSGLEAVARLRSVEVDLALSDVYAGLVFDSD